MSGDPSRGGSDGFERFDEQLLLACQQDLELYLHDQPGIYAAILVSADGLQLASASNTFDSEITERMSAMTSSLFALGEVAAREGEMGACSHVSIEASERNMLVFSIPLPPDWLVLSIITEKKLLLGMLLWSGGQLANRLRQRCEQSLFGEV